MKDYLVTVIVPAYNHEKYVLECLESIHQQTYRDFLWIVVDDCSSDSTPEILKRNQKKYGYELILHSRNLGISQTLTDTIKDYAKGDYLVLCASDDVLMPTKIESQLKYLQNNPQYGMCYSRSIMINESSEVRPWHDNINYKSGYIFEDVLCRKISIGVDTMYKREVVESVGYFAPNVIAEDFYLYAKITQKYLVGFLDMYLYKYRVAELSKKRDPWNLVVSHRQTIDLFKDEEVYGKAVKAWEIKSSLIISSYKRYKCKALLFFFRNINHFISYPRDFMRMIKYLLFIWK